MVVVVITRRDSVIYSVCSCSNHDGASCAGYEEQTMVEVNGVVVSSCFFVVCHSVFSQVEIVCVSDAIFFLLAEYSVTIR